MGDPCDATIVDGLRAGDVVALSAAWAAMYETHFDHVWQLAGRLIGPDAAAVADVVQDTFLAAAKSLGSFDPRRGSLWMWLAGITRNRVGDHFRRRYRDGRNLATQGGDPRDETGGPAAGGAAALDQLADPDAPDPQGPLLSAEQAELVRLTLIGLADEHQAVLAARYLDDVPVEEIARQTGATPVAVRSRLARARAAFREAWRLREAAGRVSPQTTQISQIDGDEASHER